ncbi:hypothetical protein RQP46_003010 [Phenoliferia psychrophenolica]
MNSPRQSTSQRPLLPHRASQSQPHAPHHFHAPPARKRPTILLFALSTVFILVLVGAHQHSSGGGRWTSLQELEEIVRSGASESPEWDLPVTVKVASDPAGEDTSLFEEEDRIEVVPIPWREVEPAVEEASLDEAADESLPVCTRTILYKFGNMQGRHGFGSEVAILLRAAAVARHFSYTLLLDDSEWNYGSWTSYFDPPILSCTPPPEGSVHRKPMVTSTADLASHSLTPAWTKVPHIVWHRDVDGLDALALNLWTDREQLEELHKADATPASTPLSPEATLPEVFWKIFGVEEAVLRDLWKPDEALRQSMSVLEEQLGVAQDGEEGVSQAVDAGDVTIAMHVRLGDKWMEVDNIGPSAYTDEKGTVHPSSHRAVGPGLHSEAITTYLVAARESVSRVLATNDVDPDEGGDRSRTRRGEEDWKGRPTLVIMSDDPEAWKDFRKDERAREFRVVGTAAVKKARAVEDPAKPVVGGFNELDFNQLPIAERIALTRDFVRDVTVLSTKADALVVSASSNVGRLMALLCGAEKAIQQGRVRSVDTRWFPTARFQ